MSRIFWCLASLVMLPIVAVSALRAVFRGRRSRPDLRVVGPTDCGAAGCVECGAWRGRFGGAR